MKPTDFADALLKAAFSGRERDVLSTLESLNNELDASELNDSQQVFEAAPKPLTKVTTPVPPETAKVEPQKVAEAEVAVEGPATPKELIENVRSGKISNADAKAYAAKKGWA